MRIKNYNKFFNVGKDLVTIKESNKAVQRFSLIQGLIDYLFHKKPDLVMCTDWGSIVFIKKADLENLGSTPDSRPDILSFETEEQWNGFFESIRDRSTHIPVPAPVAPQPAPSPAPVASPPPPVPAPALAPVAPQPAPAPLQPKWHPIGEVYDPSLKAWVNPYDVPVEMPNKIYQAIDFRNDNEIFNCLRYGELKNLNDQSPDAGKFFNEELAKVNQSETRFSEARFNVGLCRLFGKGTKQDELMGTQDLVKDANLGYPKACLVLALILQLRHGDKSFNDRKNYLILKKFATRQDAVKHYLKKAAKKGEVEAQVLLGDLMGKEGIGWYSKAAEGDNPHPVACYVEGVRLMREEPALAFANFEIAAEAGHRDALYQLGLAFQYGKGLKQNVQRAIQYYQTAFHKGSGQAAYQLAILLSENPALEVYDVDGNRQTANSLLCTAATQEYFPAAYQLLSMLKRGEALDDLNLNRDMLFNKMKEQLPADEIEWLKREMQDQ